MQRFPCLVSYLGLPASHADWIINKLLHGYWWKGAPHPFAGGWIRSLLAQKVCKAKNIPINKTEGEAVMLGGKEPVVDGVVIVGEHWNYPTDLKRHGLLPRWWIYQQVDPAPAHGRPRARNAGRTEEIAQ